MKEKNEKENTIKIKFFKKIWYSITNLKKYSELKKEAAKKTFEYIVVFTFLLSLILSIIPTYKSYKFISSGVDYIKNNIPEFEYDAGILNVSSKETINIENSFLQYVSDGYNIAIDTNIEDETKVQEILNNLEGNKKAILLKNKIITLENNSKAEYEYPGAIKSFLKHEKTKFNKQDVIEYFSTPIYRYYINNTITAFVPIITSFIIINAIALIVIYVYSKISKINYKFKEIFNIINYASTLPIIIYFLNMILYGLTGLQISFIDEIYLIITLGYSILAIKTINNK